MRREERGKWVMGTKSLSGPESGFLAVVALKRLQPLVKKEHKIDQNRTQNESKFKTIFKSEKVAPQEPLGAVLGSS